MVVDSMKLTLKLEQHVLKTTWLNTGETSTVRVPSTNVSSEELSKAQRDKEATGHGTEQDDEDTQLGVGKHGEY